jgi:teichuronic acid exporter
MPEINNLSLTDRVAQGVGWNVIGIGLQRVFQLGAGIVIARILLPTDYAIAGLAGAVAGIFSIFTAHGFGLALVQRENLSDKTIHSVFWFLSMLGVGLGLITALLAPISAKIYNQPAIVPVMLVLSLSIVIGMIGSVPNAMLVRAMRFREINIITGVEGALAAVLGITIAWMGFGYWALIMPPLGAVIIKVILSFWFSRYKPIRRFQIEAIRDTSNFGFSVMGSNLAYYLASNLDYLIMGRFWSPTLFGLYYFAYNKSRLISIIITQQMSSTILPAFSRIQNDLPRLRRAFLKSSHAMGLVYLPIHVLVIGLADPLVPWIFGQQWGPSVPVFRAFAALAFLAPLTGLVSDTLFALNLPRIPLYYNIFRVSIVLPVLLFLGLNGATILTTALILLIVWYIQALIYAAYLFVHIRLSLAEIWDNLRLIVIATVLMALSLYLCCTVLEQAVSSELVVIISSIILPSLVFALLTWKSYISIYKQLKLSFLKR